MKKPTQKQQISNLKALNKRVSDTLSSRDGELREVEKGRDNLLNETRMLKIDILQWEDKALDLGSVIRRLEGERADAYQAIEAILAVNAPFVGTSMDSTGAITESTGEQGILHRSLNHIKATLNK